MMQVNQIKFEDLYFIPSRNGVSKPERERGSGIKMINMGELFQYDRIGNIPMELVPMSPRELATMCVEEGDLLFARQSLVLAGAGKVSIVTEVSEKTTFESHIIRVRLDKNKADPLFYYFYFKSPYSGIRAIVQQCAQSGIRGNDLKKISVKYPALDIQKKISHILSTYDDLIDVNRRRVQLLEEAARLLFREWFDYFRFPGYEEAKFEDRDGIQTPVGWDYLPITKVKIFKKTKVGVSVFIDTRQYYQTSEIDGTNLVGSGEEVDYENRPSRADVVPRLNSVYFAKMKDTDKVVYFNKGNAELLERILLSTGMAGFSTDEKYLAFLFGLLTSYEFVQNKNNYATGATQVSLSDGGLKKIKVILPKLELIEKYSSIVNPFLEECSYLRSQNQKLAQARDLLLPRLMSGKIDISKIDMKVVQEA